MNIVKDRALLLSVKDPEKYTRNIDKCKVVKTVAPGHHKLLVDWSLENTRKLAALGIKNPVSPIMRDYKWPGMYKPFDHQKVTASFFTAHNRCFCFSEQGTSKTAAAIWAADYLMSIGDISRVLVICPLSIMSSAWVDDGFNTAMHRTFGIAHGTREKRIKVIESKADFVIINFDGVGVVKKELKDKFDLVIIDEGSFVKTATTNRWKAINSLINSDTKVWMLTGTPAAQSPIDAFGLAKMVVPHRVPRFFTAFRDMVMHKITQFTYRPKPEATKIVRRALQPAIRFTKKQCLDLPPVTYQTREIPLSKQQKKYYDLIRKEALMEVSGEKVTAVHAAAGINKLLQVSCGATYTDSGNIIKFDAKNRIQETIQIIENASHKTIVFVPFRHAIDIVSEEIRKAGYTTEVISGGVSSTARTKIINDFQKSKDPHVLVIQPQSAAHGVTLTAANTIVWFGPVASVETWLQANERINRPSQENKMTIVKICGSPVEKRVYKMLESREATQKDLTKLYEHILTEK